MFYTSGVEIVETPVLNSVKQNYKEKLIATKKK